MLHIVRYIGRGRYVTEGITSSSFVAERIVARILAAEPAAPVSIIRFAKGNF